MRPRLRHRHLSLVAGLLAAASQAGCPADCFSTVTVTVTVANDVDAATGAALVVVTVADIRGGDVTGTDEDDIPVGAAPHGTAMAFSFAAGTRTYRDEQPSAPPYPTWVYAFVDRDGDRALDAGEPFGVSADNPLDLGAGSGCSDGEAAVIIDRVRGG